MLVAASYHLLKQLASTRKTCAVEEAEFTIAEKIPKAALSCDVQRRSHLIQLGLDLGIVFGEIFECRQDSTSLFLAIHLHQPAGTFRE